MKKASLFMILAMLAVLGYAQTGLFGLSYGDDYETAKTTLRPLNNSN